MESATHLNSVMRMGSGSMNSATHLDSAGMRMGSGSINPATHLDMDPAELEEID